MTDDNRRLAALCAIAKNEGRYLAEWAVYHRMIGFDDILVYDNESTDETGAVLRRLQDAGVLQFLSWPNRSDGLVQKRAYADGLRRLRPAFKWIAFFDIDEFLFIPGFDNSLPRFLEAYDHLDAIAVNWSMFGTSHHKFRIPALVTERFTMRANSEHGGNRAVKTLAKTRSLKAPNLHNHEFNPGVVYQTVAGLPIERHAGRSKAVAHGIVQLNHYFTKSTEEWEAKVARGRATKPIDHPDKFRKPSDFARHDRNDVRDVSLLPYAALIKAKLANLGFEPDGSLPESEQGIRDRFAADLPAQPLAMQRVSYSRFAEDLIADTLLTRRAAGVSSAGTAGTYVDVGAGWPVRNSNTYSFYLQGWSGLCIDPQPDFAAEFEKLRPNDTCVTCAVSDEPGEATYFMFKNPALNTLNRKAAERMDQGASRGQALVGERTVAVAPLQALIDAHLPGRDIDFVSVCANGLELPVLQSIDFSRSRPRLFAVATKVVDVEQSLNSRIHLFMREQGYTCVAVTSRSMFYATA